MASFSQAHLDMLEAAIAGNETCVSFDNKNVNYRGTDEMRRIRSIVRRELGLDPGSSPMVSFEQRPQRYP